MQTFQYQYGDRPLEGYTIQRGVGRGGFGEVYYAVSDSGKQVALKVLQTYEQIELRGISQCMNLKSSHLVTVFDVRYNQQGRPFVIMEYVSGPSLAEIIQESPGGLGTQKAAFFLREIAKGLGYLHDCGIVHRDLKPSNIFFEDGRVKIGDYGLSKAMNTSRHSGQTITVGTVHYMAPEIGAGCYNRSIDIYALGIVLYEMLTGQVPFFGNSPAEVLMKHISAEPDLTGIEEPFARAIRKAMAKDPEQRYQTVQEMVEDVFGAEHIRNSVSQFSPQSLSMVGQKLNIPRPTPGAVPPTPVPPAPRPQPAGPPTDERASGAMRRVAAQDPITGHERHVLAIIASLVIGIGGAVFISHGRMTIPMAFGIVLMVNVAAKLILWSRVRWLANLEDESGWLRRLAMGGVAAVPTGLIAMVFANTSGPRMGENAALAIALGMCLTDWWKVSDPARYRRVMLGHALWVGFLAYIVAHILGAGHAAPLAAAVLAGTSLVVQILTPFHMGQTARVAFDQARHRGQPQHREAAPAAGAAHPRHAGPVPAAPDAPRAYGPAPVAAGYRVPWGVRVIWLLLFVGATAVAVGVAADASNWPQGNDDFAGAMALAAGLGMIGFFALVRMFISRFPNWYVYLIRPFLQAACVAAAVGGLLLLGCRGWPPFIPIVFLVAGCLGFVACWIPSRFMVRREGPDRYAPHASPGVREQVSPGPAPARPQGAVSTPAPRTVGPAGPPPLPANVSPFKRIWALILCGGFMIGLPGLHRFYVGKIGTGLLWFFTGGLCGIGQIVDAIMIITGGFTDSEDRPLVMWESEDEIKDSDMRKPSAPAAEPPHAAPPPVEAQHEGRPASEPVAVEAPRTHYRSSVIDQVRYASSSMVSALMGLLGYVLLLLGLIVALAVAVHVPQIIAAGFPDPSLADELQRAMGPGWPALLQQIGAALVIVLFLFATVCLIIARRNAGGMHLVRAVLGIFGLLSVQMVIRTAFDHADSLGLAEVLRGHNVEQHLAAFFESVQTGPLYTAAGLFVLSVVLLAWPPKRNRAVLSGQA